MLLNGSSTPDYEVGVGLATSPLSTDMLYRANGADALRSCKDALADTSYGLVRDIQKVLLLALDRSKRIATTGSAGSTGFVTFTSLAAATAASQTTLCHKSFGLRVRFSLRTALPPFSPSYRSEGPLLLVAVVLTFLHLFLDCPSSGAA
jgi:hypothetical protein